MIFKSLVATNLSIFVQASKVEAETNCAVILGDPNHRDLPFTRSGLDNPEVDLF